MTVLKQDQLSSLFQSTYDQIVELVKPTVLEELGLTQEFLDDENNENTPEYDRYFERLSEVVQGGMNELAVLIATKN